jgi:molecular chaperone HtpG
MSGATDTLGFKAEARQLLQLMVHSVYSNRDVFLRELISNASDALDRLRLESLRDRELDADVADLHITIEADHDQQTLTVRDNGIGMSREQVVDLIGTIAKSGTAEFIKKFNESREAAAAGLIGQFGIGFYSSFMVASKVELITRRAGSEEGTRWESDGQDSYTIEPLANAPQGTSVTLWLKPADDEDRPCEYASSWKIRELVKRYSDFIAWPIRLDSEVPNDDGTTTRDIETLNSMKALWARPRDEVKPEEYHEFYKHISHDWNDPLETIHMKAEGSFEYEAILFLPAKAPFDLLRRDAKRGVQLYVKRVFIMDDCEALMPSYLRFVKGVVDAQDLSLNVSREVLQQDRQIHLMQRRLVKKVLSTMKAMMTDDLERYQGFWDEMGKAVKEGLLGDVENRQSILKVALFTSTKEPHTSLESYVERMPEDQDHIYYLTGESLVRLESSPHLEAFRAKGYEVLLLADPVDEMWVESAGEFAGKQFRSVAKGRAEVQSEDHAPDPAFAGMLDWMTAVLDAQVKETRLSSRLTTSPACLVSDEFGMTPALERMYRAAGHQLPSSKRILELNPAHPLVTALRERHAVNPGELAGAAELVYGLAVLAEGGQLPDPTQFSKLLSDCLRQALPVWQ